MFDFMPNIPGPMSLSPHLQPPNKKQLLWAGIGARQGREGFLYQGPPWSPPPVSCVLIFWGGYVWLFCLFEGKKMFSGQLFGFSA